MRTAIVGVFVTTGLAVLAAPQQTTQRPGEMTEPRVVVQNRGAGQAIPVDLRDVNTESPLRVQVVNGGVPPYSGPLPVHVVRPGWEYKSVVVSTRDDPAAALRADGEGGWETTGIMFVNGTEARVLLKRMR